MTSDSAPASELVVPAPSAPLAVARHFLKTVALEGDQHLIRSHRGTFYRWDGTCWPELDERALRAELYVYLEDALYERTRGEDVELVPWAPSKAKIANVVDALHGATHLAASIDAPAWLDADETTAPSEIISMANGLLNLRTRELRPHTPTFFAQHSLPFAFDPNAPEPVRWRHFLRELWPDEQESIDTLAEMMGYILSGATAQQKMFLIVGPKRSGKGTMGRIITGLLGAHNVAAPTLSSLTSNFGVAPLIGKPLAIISDARLSSRGDNIIAAERLLSISGEDSLTVDRKFQFAWTGRLPTRFVILSNELPRIADSSGALASRFILLVLTTSFYGREDPTLTKQLLEEAPGIFNWALEGLDRLHSRGYFTLPLSAREALQHFEDLGSPVGAFVRDSCVVGPGHEIPTQTLWEAWKIWSDEEGRQNAGTKAMFIKDLRAAVALVRPSRPRHGDSRRRILKGIALRGAQSEAPWTTPDHDPSAAAGPGWSEDPLIVSPNGPPTGGLDEMERPIALHIDSSDATNLTHAGREAQVSETETPHLAALARVVAAAVSDGRARLHPLDGAPTAFGSATSAPRLGYITSGHTALILEEPSRRILKDHIDESILAAAMRHARRFQHRDRTFTAVELPLARLAKASSAVHEPISGDQ
jgi:putative DNA primase/helicase